MPWRCQNWLFYCTVSISAVEKCSRAKTLRIQFHTKPKMSGQTSPPAKISQANSPPHAFQQSLSSSKQLWKKGESKESLSSQGRRWWQWWVNPLVFLDAASLLSLLTPTEEVTTTTIQQSAVREGRGGRSWRLRPIIVWCCCRLIAVDNDDDAGTQWPQQQQGTADREDYERQRRQALSKK